MTEESRYLYYVNDAKLNRIFQSISDRLDSLEGLRATANEDNVNTQLKGPLTIGRMDTEHYAYFNEDGELSFIGRATVYNDLVFPIDSAIPSAFLSPVWGAFKDGTNAYRFGVNDEMNLTLKLPNNYNNKSDFDIYLDWASNGTDKDDRYVKWKIELTLTNPDFGFPSTETYEKEIAIMANTDDMTLFHTNFGTIYGGFFFRGAVAKIMVKRVAAVGKAPASAPFGLVFGVHLDCNSVGSTTKTYEA